MYRAAVNIYEMLSEAWIWYKVQLLLVSELIDCIISVHASTIADFTA